MTLEDKKVLKGFAIGLAIGLLIIGLTFAIIFGNDNGDIPKSFYFNETMTYDGIELTVSKMATVEEIESNSDLKRVIILFTLKNTRTESFNFHYSDFVLKTEDKGEKYNYVTFGTTIGDAIKDILKNDILGETLLAGETKSFYIMFDTPYKAHEKKFVLCVDWNSSSHEKHYFLYNRDGSFVPNEADNLNASNSLQKDALIKLRDEVYDIFKTEVYDKIDGKMYYSDIEKLMDSAKRQCKNASSNSLNIEKDYSNGVYFPKWIVTMTDSKGQKHAFFYIEVELSTSFIWQHKYMAKYQIN